MPRRDDIGVDAASRRRCESVAPLLGKGVEGPPRFDVSVIGPAPRDARHNELDRRRDLVPTAPRRWRNSAKAEEVRERGARPGLGPRQCHHGRRPFRRAAGLIRPGRQPHQDVIWRVEWRPSRGLRDAGVVRPSVGTQSRSVARACRRQADQGVMTPPPGDRSGFSAHRALAERNVSAKVPNHVFAALQRTSSHGLNVGIQGRVTTTPAKSLPNTAEACTAEEI